MLKNSSKIPYYLLWEKCLNNVKLSLKFNFPLSVNEMNENLQYLLTEKCLNSIKYSLKNKFHLIVKEMKENSMFAYREMFE